MIEQIKKKLSPSRIWVLILILLVFIESFVIKDPYVYGWRYRYVITVTYVSVSFTLFIFWQIWVIFFKER